MNEGATWPRRAAIFGATGGIGAALCRALADDGVEVFAGSRSGEAPKHAMITPFRFDLESEESIEAAASDMSGEPPEMIVVATGILTLPDGAGPERSYKAIDPEFMSKLFRVNTIGPALVAKHMLPLISREKRSLLATVSAKVGSIGDNRTGGWHSYRASKAALNMLVKNLAIELHRTHREAVVAALHPGTVDTPLSRPFQANLPEGQLATRREAALALIKVMKALRPEDSGKLLSWDGSEIIP